jgi:microcystin degradation protein MlrC
MAFKLVIAGIVHETNTYCGETTPLDAFEIHRGDEAVERTRGTRTYEGGMLDAAQELGAEPKIAFLAETQPSGTIQAGAYDALKEDLLSCLKEALPADAVALALHGAGIAEGVDDLEGDLCRAVRELVGPDVPIVVSLDLHGNLSQEFADTVDACFGVHYYPHTDMYERGHEAVSLLPRLLDGSVKPVAQVERLPMLMPTTQTMDGPMVGVNELCWELEKLPGVLDVTFFHGFPYTDIPLVGSHVVATTDGDVRLAQECAVKVARYVWDRRETFRAASLSAEEAVARALAETGAPVVINETSDNPGGGTPGDGTQLLRALLAARPENSAFGFIVDPEVARQAHRAGTGATIEVRLGGKTDRLHGEPIEATARVKLLTDGQFKLRAIAAGSPVDLGPTARLVIDGLDVIVASKRSQTLDAEVFLLHGIDVTRCRIVALKSSNHFRAGFQPLAHRIITADPPGLTTLQVQVFERSRTRRPIWPLDADAEYVPSVTTEAALT